MNMMLSLNIKKNRTVRRHCQKLLTLLLSVSLFTIQDNVYANGAEEHCQTGSTCVVQEKRMICNTGATCVGLNSSAMSCDTGANCINLYTNQPTDCTSNTGGKCTQISIQKFVMDNAQAASAAPK